MPCVVPLRIDGSTKAGHTDFRSAQVVVYVDGTRVGEALASEETPHHIIHRLCELDLAVSDLQQPPQQKGVGFRLKLPNLMQGKHEVCFGSLPAHPCTSALLFAHAAWIIVYCKLQTTQGSLNVV